MLIYHELDNEHKDIYLKNNEIELIKIKCWLKIVYLQVDKTKTMSDTSISLFGFSPVSIASFRVQTLCVTWMSVEIYPSATMGLSTFSMPAKAVSKWEVPEMEEKGPRMKDIFHK